GCVRCITNASSMARLKPAMTCRSLRSRSNRCATMPQLPLFRSVNRMAGPSSRYERTLSASVSGPRPVLLIARSPPSVPVMRRTASSIPSASEPCAMTMPCTALTSFIVLLQILAHARHRLIGPPCIAPLHAFDQPFVELLRRVVPRVAQQQVHRDDFRDHRDVLAGVERDRHGGKRHAEDLRRRAVQARTLVRLRTIPVRQLDHDLDAFLLADRTNAEQSANVDQSDAADLHVMGMEVQPPTEQYVIAAFRNLYDVVRNQAMPALDQVEHALALADAAATDEQEPDAVDVGHRAVHRRGRGERVVEPGLQPPIELARLELGAQHRYARRIRKLDQDARHLLVLGDDHGGNRQAQQPLDGFPPCFVIDRAQVPDFRLAEHLQATARKPLAESRQCEPG